MPAKVVHPTCGVQLSHHCVDQGKTCLPVFPGCHFFSMEFIPVNGFAHFVIRVPVPVLNRSGEQVEHLAEKKLSVKRFRRFAVVTLTVTGFALLPKHANGETTGTQVGRQTGGARFHWVARFVGRGGLGFSEIVDEIDLPRNFPLQPRKGLGFPAWKVRNPGMNFVLQRGRKEFGQFIG